MQIINLSTESGGRFLWGANLPMDCGATYRFGIEREENGNSPMSSQHIELPLALGATSNGIIIHLICQNTMWGEQEQQVALSGFLAKHVSTGHRR